MLTECVTWTMYMRIKTKNECYMLSATHHSTKELKKNTQSMWFFSFWENSISLNVKYMYINICEYDDNLKNHIGSACALWLWIWFKLVLYCNDWHCHFLFEVFSDIFHSVEIVDAWSSLVLGIYEYPIKFGQRYQILTYSELPLFFWNI